MFIKTILEYFNAVYISHHAGKQVRIVTFLFEKSAS